jgi:uncharacterized protein (DUF885 family)
MEALTDPALTDPERRVLLALFSFRGRSTNTVWPSISSLSDRANIRDATRVSKITTSLASKGWLSKKKRGFTGGNQYVLRVPERLSNLDSETNLEDAPNLDRDALSNLDSETKSNLDSDAKYKEQTIEQTIEHKTKGGRKKTPFRASEIHLPDTINAESWVEWCEFRRKTKKPITEHAAKKLIKLLSAYPKHVQEKMVDDSIQNDWQGLFPPKGSANETSNGNHAGSGGQPGKQTAAERLREQARYL